MSEENLKTVTMSMDRDLHKALKARAAQDDVKMYVIVDEALRAWGVNPADAGEQDNEKNSSSK